MTAPLSPAPALTAEEAARVAVFGMFDEEIRARLDIGAALAAFGDMDRDEADEYAEILLPTVLRIAEERAVKRAAEELRAAADWMRRNHYNGPSRHLRNRAAALDANPAPEPVAHNHTRFRNDAGPWSPCPVSCPAAGLLR